MKAEEGYSKGNPTKHERFAAKILKLQQNTGFTDRLSRRKARHRMSATGLSEWVPRELVPEP